MKTRSQGGFSLYYTWIGVLVGQLYEDNREHYEDNRHREGDLVERGHALPRAAGHIHLSAASAKASGETARFSALDQDRAHQPYTQKQE
jgi:hypothetical protein